MVNEALELDQLLHLQSEILERLQSADVHIRYLRDNYASGDGVASPSAQDDDLTAPNLDNNNTSDSLNLHRMQHDSQHHIEHDMRMDIILEEKLHSFSTELRELVKEEVASQLRTLGDTVKRQVLEEIKADLPGALSTVDKHCAHNPTETGFGDSERFAGQVGLNYTKPSAPSDDDTESQTLTGVYPSSVNIEVGDEHVDTSSESCTIYPEPYSTTDIKDPYVGLVQEEDDLFPLSRTFSSPTPTPPEYDNNNVTSTSALQHDVAQEVDQTPLSSLSSSPTPTPAPRAQEPANPATLKRKDRNTFQSSLVRAIEENLWRGNWNAAGKPGTLHEYIRKQRKQLLEAPVPSTGRVTRSSIYSAYRSDNDDIINTESHTGPVKRIVTRRTATVIQQPDDEMSVKHVQTKRRATRSSTISMQHSANGGERSPDELPRKRRLTRKAASTSTQQPDNESNSEESKISILLGTPIKYTYPPHKRTPLEYTKNLKSNKAKSSESTMDLLEVFQPRKMKASK